MKCSALLPQVALVLAVAYACSDSTSPALSNAVVVGNQRASVVGKQPPPPLTTAITITITPGAALAVNSLAAPTFASAPFTGKYFSNGPVAGVCDVGDPTGSVNGTAWLQLDNTQPTTLGTASANARFKAHDMRCTGAGTLIIEGQTVVITSVELFEANPECLVTGEICAHIEFTATVDGFPGQRGHADAFDIDACFLDPGEGNPFYVCGSGE